MAFLTNGSRAWCQDCGLDMGNGCCTHGRVAEVLMAKRCRTCGKTHAGKC